MNISSVDLNLLLVLHTVLTEKSATKAARKLHVTQSAVSNALARLRRELGDPLVVRHARGLSPTPRALAMQADLQRVVDGVSSILAEPQRFDPSTTTREFTIACADYYGVVLCPPLVSALRTRAPRATLRLLPLEKLANDGLATNIDVHVGMPPRVPSGCKSSALFMDRFVCLTRASGKRAARMSMKEFLAASHLRVQVLDNTRDTIDDLLAKKGHARNVVLTVPHFSLVPLVVARTGYVATLSRRLAETYADVLPLCLREPPFSLPARSAQMVWHERTDTDEGARFFRGLLREVARSTSD
jgi:DNA-binding transcriptional LysR family regulator